MTKLGIDTLIEKLYSSNDPLCFEAAATIEEFKKSYRLQENKLGDVSLAAKYMLESLIEINHLSRDRDNTPGVVSSDQLRLRLKECGNIATDTINLKSVKRAYERMYNE